MQVATEIMYQVERNDWLKKRGVTTKDRSNKGLREQVGATAPRRCVQSVLEARPIPQPLSWVKWDAFSLAKPAMTCPLEQEP